MKGNNIDET